jgi:hypothetical protein
MATAQACCRFFLKGQCGETDTAREFSTCISGTLSKPVNYQRMEKSSLHDAFFKVLELGVGQQALLLPLHKVC